MAADRCGNHSHELKCVNPAIYVDVGHSRAHRGVGKEFPSLDVGTMSRLRRNASGGVSTPRLVVAE